MIATIAVIAEKKKVQRSQRSYGNHFSGITVEFLKVVRMVFWSGVVGPGTNDFYPLQRAKFTGGKVLL